MLFLSWGVEVTFFRGIREESSFCRDVGSMSIQSTRWEGTRRMIRYFFPSDRMVESHVDRVGPTAAFIRKASIDTRKSEERLRPRKL